MELLWAGTPYSLLAPTPTPRASAEYVQTREEWVGLCLFTWSEKRKGGSKEAQAELEAHFSLDPACLCHSLRWARGFSLREGNGFWPKTTEPLHFRLASPLPNHSSGTCTWGLEDWGRGVGGEFRHPFPQGRLPRRSPQPSVLS